MGEVTPALFQMRLDGRCGMEVYCMVVFVGCKNSKKKEECFDDRLALASLEFTFMGKCVMLRLYI